MKREHVLAVLGLGVLLGVGCAVDPRDPPPGEAESIGVSRQDIGGGSTPGCENKSFCYCACRVDHPCFLDGSQCGPLGTCLTSCDHQYPIACPDTGNPFPRTLRDCI
jgi:hypothetical protein